MLNLMVDWMNLKKGEFREAALFTSKAKVNIFWNFFNWSSPEGSCGVKKKIQKTWFLHALFHFWATVSIVAQCDYFLPPQMYIWKFLNIKIINIKTGKNKSHWIIYLLLFAGLIIRPKRSRSCVNQLTVPTVTVWDGDANKISKAEEIV